MSMEVDIPTLTMDIITTVTRMEDIVAEIVVRPSRRSFVRPTTVTTTMTEEITETTTRSHAIVLNPSLLRGRTLETGSLLTGTRLTPPTEGEEEELVPRLTGDLLHNLRADHRTVLEPRV